MRAIQVAIITTFMGMDGVRLCRLDMSLIGNSMLNDFKGISLSREREREACTLHFECCFQLVPFSLLYRISRTILCLSLCASSN